MSSPSVQMSTCERDWVDDHLYGSAQGSDQSIGSPPCVCSRSLTRLYGREPKNPRDADSGLGCTLSTRGTYPSTGRND